MKPSESFFHSPSGSDSSVLLDLQNLLAVIVTANFAYTMGTHHLVTSGIGTLHQPGHGKLTVVGTSLISASL